MREPEGRERQALMLRRSPAGDRGVDNHEEDRDQKQRDPFRRQQNPRHNLDVKVREGSDHQGADQGQPVPLDVDPLIAEEGGAEDAD